jgi:hypothetical protein
MAKIAQGDVVVTGVAEMVARLKELDPKQVTLLRKRLRDSANTTASKIKAQIGTTPPISGMGGSDHRTDWGGAVTSVQISFAGNKRRNITPLLKIKVDTPRNAVGYLIAEHAGKRGGAGETPQGSNLIAVLTDRLGTIKGRGKGAQRQLAWRHFWAERRQLNRDAAEIIAHFEKVSTGEINA